MSAIIAEKQIVVKAIDKVTEPLALMDQRLNNLVQRFDALSQKMQTGVGGQQAFKSSLNEVKASASETAEATAKLDHTIDGLHDKKIKISAETGEADEKSKHLEETAEKLSRETPTIKAKADTAEANEKLDSLKHTTESVGHSFTRLRTIIAGTAFGTAIGSGLTNAFNEIKTGIIGSMQAGIEFDMTMQKMNATWDTLTGSAGKARSMSDSIVDLSNKLGWSVDVTNELAQQFYHVFDNQPETMKLTKSFLTMGDAIGLSSDRLEQVGMDFTHMLSSSKLQLGDMNQITDAFPMFGEALLEYERKVQHSSHLTMSQLREDISKGKVSAKDAENVFNELGDKYKQASENLMGTLPGMFRQIQSKWKQLMGDAMAPSVNAANPIVKQVSEWVGDKNTTKEFENLGKAVNDGVGSIVKALADNFGDGSVSKMLDNVVNGLTRFVQAASKWTANNAGSIVKTIKSIASISGSLGKGFIDGLSDMLKAISGTSGHGLEGIANSLEAISKHKTALSIIGRILAVQFAYSKLFKIAEGFGLINNSMKLFGKWKLSGHIITDVVKLTKKLTRLKNLKINPANWFKGGKFSFKGLFKGASKEAADSGDKAGGSFVARLFSKVKGAKVEGLGRGLGSKLGGAFALAFGAIDLFKALSAKKDKAAKVGKSLGETAGGMGGAAIGASLGSVVPGIGTLIGGLLGGLIGSKAGGMIGEALGKSWGAIKKGATAVGKFLLNALTAPFKAAFKVGEWFGDKVKSILHLESRKPSKKPSSKEIKSLGGNHYSKTDIANIKQMNAAVQTYIRTLRTLKDTIKKNDPTKELNSMNSSLKQSAKYWLAISKPLNQASKSFQGMRKPLETISRAMKELTGSKSGLSAFDKDLTKLSKDLQHSKIGEEFTRLSKQIKKSNLPKTLQSLTKAIRESVKYWRQLANPIKETATEFDKFSRELKLFNGRSNPLSRLQNSVERLTRALKRNHFGNELAKQMNIANKSMSGNRSVESKFSSMTRAIERDLSRFRSSFNSDWQRAWNTLDEGPSRSLSHVVSVASSRFNAITGHERSFTSKFLSGWRSWNNSVVSDMRSAFDKLPGIAHKAMSEIVSRLNRGISSINGVISDFGGDKKLSTIHYARGTFAHPGGKAIVNDGPEPNKTELIWQPSKGWGTVQGQNVVRDLEPGAMVLDAKHSQQYLGQGIFPHYAGGTLSDDEQDRISKEFISNPIQASKNLVLKLTDWKSNVPAVADLGEATAVGFSRGIANVLKDLLGIIKEPVHGDWTPVIKSAARLLHFDIADWQISKLLRQIQTESGGKEKQTQLGGSNDPDGDGSGRALGLLQFKRSTFDADAVPGHHDIWSGFDQILAAISTLNRGGEGGWGNVGNGHGWASGVHMTHPDLALIGDNPEHDEFVINPYNSNALPLMQEASQTMMNNHPEWRMSNSNNLMAEMVSLAKTAVEKLDNINIHPYTTVEEVARPVNKYNAKNYMLRS